MARLSRRIVTAVLVACALPASIARASFVNFESQHVHPIALSPSGQRLAVVNTPDARVSIFAIDGAGLLSPEVEIPVGLEPVSAAFRTDNEIWVVNHLSDAISVVDVTMGSVVRTVQTGDEPTDILFTPDPLAPVVGVQAGSSRSTPGLQPVPALDWAWVCVSQENRVQIFDANDPGMPLHEIDIPGSDPRTMAYDADRDAVYVAVFESGNKTAVVPADIRSDPNGPWGGDLHPYQPPLDPSLVVHPGSMPNNGVIVKWNGSDWVDEGDGNTVGVWTSLVPWSVEDNDVIRIGVTANPAITATYEGVGTLLFDIAVEPTSGDLLVTNTEAHNDVYFEPKLMGTFASNRVTRIDPMMGSVTAHDANASLVGAERVSQPGQLTVRPSDGQIFYTAIGGARIGASPDGVTHARLPYREGGTGIVLGASGDKLYVVNRFTNDVSVIDAAGGALLQEMPIGSSSFDPTPDVVRNGRPFLYTGTKSLNNDLSCATCHAFANMDNVAWDLGDPTGQMDLVTLPGGQNVGFHPLKGPMVTQTLRGLEGTGRLHWRGDRDDFNAFNGAFVSLMGSPSELSPSDMQAFTDFILTVNYPPNPFVPLDNQLAGDALAGFNLFNRENEQLEVFCGGCHVLDDNLGTNGALQFLPGSRGNQFFKVPQLRNLYEKVKIDDASAANSNVRSFGFLHDGNTDSIEDFVTGPGLALETNEEQVGMTAFLKSFPTGTASAVGRQWTVTGWTSAPVSQQLPTLEQQAADGNIDLIVKGVRGGELRGFLYEPGSNTYRSDSIGDAPLTRMQLFGGMLLNDVLTFMGVPPTCGTRLGIDRDEDGWGDYDETQSGTDPADPTSFPQTTDALENGRRAPARTQITGIAPNPFNARAVVRFTMATRDHAAVAIYSADGRRVKQLSRSWIGPGEFTVRWDGTTEAGVPAASGIYFVTLDTSNARDQRKVTLLK